MDRPYGGGSWSAIPSIAAHGSHKQQHHHHQSLTSHFHLLDVVENLGDAIENGSRDQHSDALMVEGQKRKVEESEKLINQQRDLIAKYRNTVQELIKSEL